MPGPWPSDPERLIALQRDLAARSPDPWIPPEPPYPIGGVFVCFLRGEPYPGRAGEPGWAGAAVTRAGRLVGSAVIRGEADAPYRSGLLALREGRLLQEAVRALGPTPEVLLVNATGRDHPRRAGLALHLGAALELPTVGVTHRPLVAEGDWPPPSQGATAPLTLEGAVVGHWVRTRGTARPLAAHAAWRTEPGVSAAVLAQAARGARTPEPIREARRLARTARSAEGRR